jgi:hypothetical protein
VGRDGLAHRHRRLVDHHRNAVDFAVQNRAFDAVFEQKSGDLIVAFGREGQLGFGWVQWTALTSFWSTAIIDARAPAMGEPHFVALAAEPGTDRVAAALCDLGDGAERLGTATWSGSTWIAATELDAQTRNWDDKAQGRFPCAAGWHGGEAVVVYADEAGQLSWGRWDAAGGWILQPDLAVAGVGALESVRMASAGDRLVTVFVDDKKKLFSASYAGSWTRLAPSPLTDKLIVEGVTFDVVGP